MFLLLLTKQLTQMMMMISFIVSTMDMKQTCTLFVWRLLLILLKQRIHIPQRNDRHTLPTEKAKASAPSGWRDTSDTDTVGGTCPPGPQWWRWVGCLPLHPAGHTQAPVYLGRTSPATHHETTFSWSQIGAGTKTLMLRIYVSKILASKY